MIYLDYNATTPVLPEVFAAMRPYYERHFGNPSSIHAAGREARAAIDDARDRLAAVIGAKPHEIIFTGGGTEAANLAIFGLARSCSAKGRHLITATTEHHAVLHAFEYLQKHEIFRVTRLPVDRFGVVDPDDLRDAFETETTLVSIMWANNETGTLEPIQEISRLCRERGVLFHSDVIQAFGKTPMSLHNCDAASIAAHKFYGPKGAGALYLRGGIPIQRILFGGSHENERRPGTENVPAIVGMAKAAELAAIGIEREQQREAALRDKLWNAVREIFPTAIMNGHPHQRLGNTLNVSFPGLDGETLLINLDLEGICASSGSACMVGSIVPSHVLMGMGSSPELARSTVRFSVGKPTTKAEIDAVIERLPRIFARLQPELV